MVHMTVNLTDALTVGITSNLFYHDLMMVLLMDQMMVSSTVASIPVITYEIHTNPPNYNY